MADVTMSDGSIAPVPKASKSAGAAAHGHHHHKKKSDASKKDDDFGPTKPVLLYEHDEREEYSERPGSHPFLNSILRFKKTPSSMTGPEYNTYIRTREFPKDLPPMQDIVTPEKNWLAGVGPPVNPEDLPLSWAPAPKIASAEEDPEAWRMANQDLVIFIPIESLPSSDKFHFADTTQRERMLMAAFHFVSKAIVTGRVGSSKNNEGALHRFKNAYDQSLSKVEVVGEILVREGSDKLLTKHLNAYYQQDRKGESPPYSKETIAKAVADVDFRVKLLARSNIIGVRFWIFIIDTSLDVGRAFQKRLLRNQVAVGEASPAEVAAREERWDAERKKKNKAHDIRRKQLAELNVKRKAQGMKELGMWQYQEMEEQGQISAPVVPPDEDDVVMGEGGNPKPTVQNPPEDVEHMETDHKVPEEIHAPSPLELAEKKFTEKRAALAKEREEAVMLGDEDRVKAIDAQMDKVSKQSEKGPSQKQVSEAKSYTARNVLGIRFEDSKIGTRYPSLLFKLKDQAERFSSSSVMGSTSSKRAMAGEARRMSDEERRQQASRATGRDASVVLIFRSRDIVTALSSLLDINTETPQKAETSEHHRKNLLREALYKNKNIMLDELQDMHPVNGQRHPYHPADWLTFENMTVGWQLRDRVCHEQLNARNYFDPKTKQFVVPFPCLAWRLPSENGFKSKVLARKRPFWVFDELSELMDQCTRKYRARVMREQVELAKENASLDVVKQTNDLIDFVVKDPQRRDYLKRREAELAKEYEASEMALEQLKFEKKYPRALVAPECVVVSSGLGTAPNPQQLADKEKNEILVRDILGDALEDANNLFSRVKELAKKCPEDEKALIRAFRKHQFAVYCSLMRPDADKLYPNNKYGMNMVHSQHVKTLYEGNPSNPPIYFKHSGYENLTLNASIMAQWVHSMYTIVGVTNSIHVLWTMFAQMNVSAYYAFRTHGIHVLKVGSAGCGKSWMDAILKRIKVPGTVEDAIHSSDKAKLVEVSQDDRIIIQDEADQNVVGDASKAATSQDYKAKMLTKAYLGSNGVMGFSVFQMNAEGNRVTIHKQVAVRSCQTLNSNIYAPAKDGSIYDRLMRYIIVPSTKPVKATLEIIRKELNPSLSDAANHLIESEMRPWEMLQFRGCKLIGTLAAAKPLITDTLLHLLRGIPKLEKYGVSSETSMRRLACVMDLSKCLTITMAVYRAFRNGPTISRRMGVTETRPWMEAMMREVKYRLYATPDITIYVLSQGYRQMIGDYEGWNAVYCIAKMQLGHMDCIFDDLFNREAYHTKQVRGEDGKMTLVRGKKRFPFIRVSDIHGKNRRPEDVPKYVKDEDLRFKQWEVAGFFNERKPKGVKEASDVIRNLRYYPAFMCWKEGSVGLTAEENQAKTDFTKLPTTSAQKDSLQARVTVPKGARQQQTTIHGAPPSMANAAPENTTQNDSAIRSAADGGSRPAAANPTVGHSVNIIDPNWIIHPGTLKEAIQKAARDRSATSFCTESIAEYAIRHMCEGRKVTVPVIEMITDADEDLHFVTRKGANGKQEILMRSVPVCCLMDVKSESVDPFTGRVVPAGNHLAISTMALYCYRPMAVLFKLLTAMEYEFTPKQTMLIDVSIPGHEGVYYTHTSFPNPRRRLRKSSCAIVAPSFMRVFLLDNSRTNYNLFLDQDNPSTVETLPENEAVYNKIYEEQESVLKAATEWANNAENRAELDRLMATKDDDDDDGGNGARDAPQSKLLSGSKRSLKNTSSATRDDSDDSDVERAKSSSRKRMGLSVSSSIVDDEAAGAKPVRKAVPSGLDNDHISRHAVQILKAKGDFYTRYHLHEAFEAWLVDEYGKNINKEGSKPITKKSYYPGNDDKRTKEERKCGVQFQMTRIHFKGVLPTYPEDLINDAKQLRRAEIEEQNGSKEPGDADLDPEYDPGTLPEAACVDMLASIAAQLKAQREAAALRLEDKKTRQDPKKVVEAELAKKAKEAVQKRQEDNATNGGDNGAFIALGITEKINDDLNKVNAKRLSETRAILERQNKAMAVSAAAAAAAGEQGDSPKEVSLRKKEKGKKQKHHHRHHHKKNKHETSSSSSDDNDGADSSDGEEDKEDSDNEREQEKRKSAHKQSHKKKENKRGDKRHKKDKKKSSSSSGHEEPQRVIQIVDEAAEVEEDEVMEENASAPVETAPVPPARVLSTSSLDATAIGAQPDAAGSAMTGVVQTKAYGRRK